MKKIILYLIVGTIVLGGFNNALSLKVICNDFSERDIYNNFSKANLDDNYDMVIIAPEYFSTDLEPLIHHKNNYDVKTILKTTEEIFSTYNGRDKPEQIKYFIKDATETWNTKYILLVGGLKHYIWNEPRDTKNYGEQYWHVPVRYSNLVEPNSYNWYDPGFISDLYYADIYDDKGDFSSWDTDNNGIYGEWNLRDWTSNEKDILDLYPDVCVGRLACRNKYEVKVVVDKIITYESQTYGEDWYNKIILAGGNGFDDPPTNYMEGEVICEYISENYMTEYIPIKLYASNLNISSNYLPTPKNLIRELSVGCGFLYIGGHGKPGKIRTYWPDETGETHSILDITHLLQLNNGYKLPIALLGGCCNAKINISVLYPHLQEIIEMWGGYWDIVGLSCPKSLCWGLVSNKRGGSIATIGYTGFGYVSFGEKGDLDGNGINDPDFVEEKHGYLFQSFFKAIDDGAETLGEAWANAISRYLDTWPAMNRWEDAKNIEAWILLGDPSLKIGGYPSQTRLEVSVNGIPSFKPDDTIELEASASYGGAPNIYEWSIDENGDGEFDFYTTGKTIEEQWDSPGIYWVQVTGIYDDKEVTAFTIVKIENNQQTTPTINGPTNVQTGRTYTYTVEGSDPNGDEPYYLIDWGDGTYDVITPDDPTTVRHKWTKFGTNKVTVKAIDSYGQFTEGTLTVTMSKDKHRSYSMPLLQFINNMLEKFPNLFPLLRQIIGLVN